ncbi:MAG: carboxymuconolactone decarboxylase family protein [Geminicoccaceae bacterium]
MTAWIKMVADEEASAELEAMLNEARTPHGTVDNVMRVHSLRPSTMGGHVRLYRAVLHDEANTVPTWLQETIASYVSILNDCAYSFSNHWANARHLILTQRGGGDELADRIEAALKENVPEQAFDGAELAMLGYARKLTQRPGAMAASDLDAMRRHGVDDGQILEVNQIVGYFNYVNRLLNGLGVTLEGDIVGYYADDGEDAA